jgi:hypothetical protein
MEAKPLSSSFASSSWNIMATISRTGNALENEAILELLKEFAIACPISSDEEISLD